MIRGRSPLAVLVATSGLIVWGIGFSVLYGLSALACEYHWTATEIAGVSLGRLILVIVWAAHIALLAWLVGWSWRHRGIGEAGASRLLAFLTLTFAVAGLVAMVWTGAPVVTTSTCLPPHSPSIYDTTAAAERWIFAGNQTPVPGIPVVAPLHRGADRVTA